MFKNSRVPTSAIPLLSVIIPVYNDWAPLEKCLQSLAQQESAPVFEIVVVDDGSDHTAPDYIQKWTCRFPLRLVRCCHRGIASARNEGIRFSKGSVLLFTDADCRLQSDCLASLGAAVAGFPLHNFFQLRISGDCSSIIGEAEDLRLRMLQDHLLDARDCIRYVNTAGFAIRRTGVDIQRGLFDPAASRAEDTILLASLLQKGEPPFFVTSAIVQHAISRSIISRLRKDAFSAYLEGYAFSKIASMGVHVRMTHGERLRILRLSWAASRPRTSAWILLIGRQLLRRAIGFISKRRSACTSLPLLPGGCS